MSHENRSPSGVYRSKSSPAFQKHANEKITGDGGWHHRDGLLHASRPRPDFDNNFVCHNGCHVCRNQCFYLNSSRKSDHSGGDGIMPESWKRLHFHSDGDAFLDNDLYRIQCRHGRFDLGFLGQVGSSILRCKSRRKTDRKGPNAEWQRAPNAEW
jgi:hypothetical protein